MGETANARTKGGYAVKNPMDARCVFIDGPVAIYVQDASPAEIRHAYDRLRNLVSCMCTELEQTEKRAQVPSARISHNPSWSSHD